jgi:Flp pilus assembly protein TadG
VVERPRVPRADGQSLVEFALVFPVFLLLLFGLIDIGRFVYSANALNQAAAEGARFGSVAAWSETCKGSRETCVEAETKNRLAAVPGATATASCTRYLTTQGRWVGATGGCRTNDLLAVEVKAKFQILTPIFGQLLNGVLIEGYSQVAVNQ